MIELLKVIVLMCQFNGLDTSSTFLEKTQKKCMKQYVHCLKTDKLMTDYGKQVMVIDCIAREVSK